MRAALLPTLLLYSLAVHCAQVFARGLFEAGYRDKAASVYYTLLQAGVDKTQQVWGWRPPFPTLPALQGGRPMGLV
jgi:hypothetical protein